MSYADKVFINMCDDVLKNGVSTKGTTVRARWNDNTPAYTIKKFGVVNRYDLEKEFPALTLRPVPFKNCIDELLWIWVKKSNNIKDLNSKIWDAWANKSGSIGRAYGYQLQKKYDFGGGRVMDQVDNVLYQLKNTPNSRRIMTNIYNFSDLKMMGLEPCAYSMTFNVTNGKLNGILNQRSQDILTANAWNVCQYAVLIHMFAHVSGLKVGEFVHVISDAHIYNKHIDLVKDLIKRKPFKAPKFVLNKKVKDFYSFKVEDFSLVDYKAGEQIKNIEVAI